MNNNCNIDKLVNGNNIKIKNDNNIEEIQNDISSDKEDKKNDEEDIKQINMFKKVKVKKNKETNRNYTKNNNIIKEEDENERSLLPFDMTKRMNSFMDFSAILNDNSKIKQSVNRKNISKIWGDDVSAIEKKDDL